VGFEADLAVEKVAEACALDAVDFAREKFELTLDWTDESIRRVEWILDRLYKEMPAAQPSEERTFEFAKMFGSYVGEVFRRNHGARWGMVTLEGGTFPGMHANRTGSEFWPWGKVHGRLKKGAEDNVWVYYSVLVAEDGRGPGLKKLDLSQPPAKRSWWRRMLGRP